jgi:hypothetical protein
MLPLTYRRQLLLCASGVILLWTITMEQSSNWSADMSPACGAEMLLEPNITVV